jgi:hypothetical protein
MLQSEEIDIKETESTEYLVVLPDVRIPLELIFRQGHA